MAGEKQAATGRAATILGVELPVTEEWCLENLGISFREVQSTGYMGYQSPPHWEVAYVEPDGKKHYMQEYKPHFAQMFLRMVELAKRKAVGGG